MSLTKIGSIGINTGIQFAGVTTIATLNSSSNVLSVGGTVNFNSDVSIGGSVSIGGTLTYEDVTNIDSVGLITARNGIVVGSGITLSKDGDIFATGVTTATTFVGALTGNVTGNISGGTVAGSTGTFTGDVSIADKIIHTGDTDTAIRFSGADTIKLETGGSERLKVDSNGDTIASGTLYADSHLFMIDKLMHTGDTDTAIRFPSADTITFETAGSERLRIDSSGYLIAKGDIRLRRTASDNGALYFGDTNNNYIFGTDADDVITFATAGAERLRIKSDGNINVGQGETVAGLRYFDVQNSSSAANTHGSIIRLITSNAAGNSTTSIDLVKYKDGNFYISNFETGGNGNTNFYNGGATRLTISQDGYVTKPNTPFFSVYGTAGNVTYNDGDEIDFENVYHNVGSHFKTTSGTGQYKRFIAPVTGVYIFTFGFFPNTASNCRIQLNLNGTDITTPYISGCFTAWGSGIGAPAGSQMLKVNAGEYVSVRVSSGTLSNTYDGHTGFQGFLLG